MIDLRFVKKLVDMIDGSSVDSIEISSDKGMRIRISKNSNQRATVQVAAPMQPQMVPAAIAPAPVSGTDGTPAELEERTEKPKARYLEVKSPMGRSEERRVGKEC